MKGADCLFCGMLNQDGGGELKNFKAVSGEAPCLSGGVRVLSSVTFEERDFGDLKRRRK